MKKIWIRAGMTLSISDEEARAVLTGDESSAGDVVKKIIAEGRFAFDGESYIPQVCVAEYNRDNGTSFEERDVEIQLDIPFEKEPTPNHQEGICPICGGSIKYGVFELDDTGGCYKWECPECGATGKEGHSLVFDGNHYDVQEG